MSRLENDAIVIADSNLQPKLHKNLFSITLTPEMHKSPLLPETANG